MTEFLELHVTQILTNLREVLIAYFLTLPIAWDRERTSVSAGLRTFPLVAVASAGFVLVSEHVIGSNGAERARILQGLMTGIGFIGGGAIVKSGTSVRGTATAASIWVTAAIGAAVAYRLYDLAIMLAIIVYATLRWMMPFKKTDEHEPDEEGNGHSRQ
ncbi:MAG: MgtC/SapB family protein [Bryobacteraceae bacterium]